MAVTATANVANSFITAATQRNYQAALIKQSADQQALNTQLALESYGRQVNAENTRVGQENATATEQILQSNIRAAKASATAAVDTAHAGVTGLSIDGLFDEFSRENSRYNAAIRLSRENDMTAAELRKKGFQAEAENRILSFQPYQPRPIEQPSLLGALLKIGGAAGEGYARYSLSNPRLSGPSGAGLGQ